MPTGRSGFSDPDLLEGPQAGSRAARGALWRTAGYFVGLSLALVSLPLLTRHLGVVDYGRYVLVASLLGIVMILADAGLTAVGVREYAVRDPVGRQHLLGNLISARLVISSVAAVGAVLFALLAGYDSVLVAGAAIGGAGLVFGMAQQTIAIGLTAELRLALLSALDLLRQTLSVLGIVVLVATGANLLAFLVLPLPVALTSLAVTLGVVGRGAIKPRIDASEWRYLLSETLPAAAASVLASSFYRLAVVMVSLVATAEETGYFGISFRVVEVFIAVPSLIVGSTYPVLARAADRNPQRLVSAFQQLFDVCVIVGAWVAFVLSAGARPVLSLLAGDDFEAATSVLQVQGVALAVTFLATAFSGTLWIVRAKRGLVVSNLVGVGLAIILTGTMASSHGARGAAVAMLLAELVLGISLAVTLFRTRSDLRPSLIVPAKVLAALLVAAAFAISPLPDLAGVVLGSIAYVTVLSALRTVRAETLRQFVASS